MVFPAQAHCWTAVPLAVPQSAASRKVLLLVLMAEYHLAESIGPVGGLLSVPVQMSVATAPAGSV